MRTRSKDKVLQEIKATKQTQLLEFLIEKNVRKSRNAIKSLLAHKQIRVNDKLVTQYNLDLQPGDMVQIMKHDQSRKERKLKGLKIVFEDDHLIVIDKDSGLLSVSTDKEKLRTVYGVLNQYIKKEGTKDSRVFVLHRLDREASGLMVFAKDMEVQGYFQRNWNHMVPEEIFQAVVEGIPSKKSGKIESWLTENKNLVMLSSTYDNGGQNAVTNYSLIKTNGSYSLLDFKLETKRKNQIRVHMQSIGHPIVGDKKYGATKNPIKRMALHASRLTIVHPITAEKLEFVSPLPKPMQQLTNKIIDKTQNERGDKTDRHAPERPA